MRKIIWLLLNTPLVGFGQLTDKNIGTIKDSVVAWRRYLHQYPELSNSEFKTSDYVAGKLTSIGIEVKRGVGKTGVVGILKGGKPGPVIALRADMDGLPVTERGSLAFASKQTADYEGQKSGVMHACGHDAHMAILLGAATALKQVQKEIAGTVVFIFQPAEEGSPKGMDGGAQAMIKDGVLDNPKVEAVFGLHINAQMEIGTIKYKAGAAMASSDWFTVKIKGKQSHGSQPWNGIDPVTVASQMITGFQTIVSRQVDLTKAPVIISVGKISGGVRNNIIPEEVMLEGTVRTFDGKMQKDVHEKMRRMATNIAEASGASAEVYIETKALVTYNDPALAKRMAPSLEAAAGKGNAYEGDWTTWAEDFSFYGEKAPAFFFFLGAMPKGADPVKTASHHTPDFYIDDSMLDVGVKAFCNFVFDYAKTKK